MKSQKSEKQREYEKLVLQLNEIFPTHALQDIISAVKKSNLDLDTAIGIVLSEFPLSQSPEPVRTETPKPANEPKKEILVKKEVVQVKEETKPAVSIPEDKIENIQATLPHLSRNTICQALLDNELDEDLTILQLLNNPPEDSPLPSNSTKQEEEEEEEEIEEEEDVEEDEDNEFYGSSTPSDSDNDAELEAWFVDPHIERQLDIERRYIESVEREAQIKRDEQIALNLQKLEEQRNKDKHHSFSTWATTDLSRIDVCAINQSKKSTSTRINNNNASSVIVEPPSREVRDFLDRIEERTVLELTGSIPPRKSTPYNSTLKLQNVLLDLKKRLAEYQSLKDKKLPWEQLQEKLASVTVTPKVNLVPSIPDIDSNQESLEKYEGLSDLECKSIQDEQIQLVRSYYMNEYIEGLSYPKRFAVKLMVSPTISLYILYLIPPQYPKHNATIYLRSHSNSLIPPDLILQVEGILNQMLQNRNNSFLSIIQYTYEWMVSIAPVLPTSIEDSSTTEYQDSLKFLVSSNYKCLSAIGLLEEQSQQINNVSNTFNISPSLARIFLNHFKWQSKDLFKAYEESSRKGQLVELYRAMELPIDLSTSSSTNQSSLHDSNTHFECSSCFEEYSSKDMTVLYCNHWFCNDCFQNYLKIKIMESGSNVDVITCPGHKCKFIVDECTIGSLVSLDLYSKYTSFVSKSFIERNPSLKYCPSKKCDCVVLLSTSTSTSTNVSPMIRCTCGLIWCYTCKLEAHWPATCEQIKWYNETHQRSNQDPDASEKTLEWLSKYTQDCPKCKSPIEKNGGCNHLSCSYCKFQFCWVCRGEWTGGSHYNCSSPQSQSDADRELALRFSVTNLTFEQVYILNEKSRLHDDQRIKSIATDRMRSYIQLPHATIDDCEVICAAIEHIFLCRHIILNICIMGQYFNKFKAAKGKKIEKLDRKFAIQYKFAIECN